jgi:hypothetical protein
MAEFHLAVHFLRAGCPNEPASGFVARSMRAVQGSRRFLRNQGGSQRIEASDFFECFSISERNTRVTNWASLCGDEHIC